MSRPLVTFLLFAVALATVALARPAAHAADPTDAVCTPVKPATSAKGFASSIEEAIDAHLAAGRTHVETTPMFGGTITAAAVCAW